MPFKPGCTKSPHAGRAKGTPNKRTAEVRSVIQLAAYGLGGWDRLVAWAKEDPANEREFWSRIFPRLLPRDGCGGSDEFGLNAHKLMELGLPSTLFGEDFDEADIPRREV